MSEPFKLMTDWFHLHWNGTAWVRVAHVVEGQERLLVMPDGPEKERAENRAEEKRPLPPEVLADALQDRITPTSGRLLKAEPIKKPATLQPGDHVMLRLSPVEEQRCVLLGRSPVRDAWHVRTVNAAGELGAESEVFGLDNRIHAAMKVPPIPVKEPTVTRGKVRIKPGCGL